ncbi:hypothetical protein S245_014905 [Arachis hypogaea]
MVVNQLEDSLVSSHIKENCNHVGILGPFLIVGSLIALFYLLKKPATKPEIFDTEQAYYNSISFRKPNQTRLFSYNDLDKATKSFEEGQKLMSGSEQLGQFSPDFWAMDPT